MVEKMSSITKCDVSKCAYNKDSHCHAFAITVGGPDPQCDTFMDSGKKGGADISSGGVGACRVSSCIHNDAWECAAGQVTIGPASNKAMCGTYESM